MNEWFDALVKSSLGGSSDADLPRLTPPQAEQVLELARVTAHTQERRFAPLATFLMGRVVERLYAEHRLTSDEEIASFLHRLWQRLEVEGSQAATEPH